MPLNNIALISVWAVCGNNRCVINAFILSCDIIGLTHPPQHSRQFKHVLCKSCVRVWCVFFTIVNIVVALLLPKPQVYVICVMVNHVHTLARLLFCPIPTYASGCRLWLTYQRCFPTSMRNGLCCKGILNTCFRSYRPMHTLARLLFCAIPTYTSGCRLGLTYQRWFSYRMRIGLCCIGILNTYVRSYRPVHKQNWLNPFTIQCLTRYMYWEVKQVISVMKYTITINDK